MTLDSIRAFCMSLPHATEQVQWGDDLVFKIGGNMFAVVVLELHPKHRVRMSFKCTPEKFEELIGREGIEPAAYVARYKWVHVSDLDAVTPAELKDLIKTSYQLVFDKLPPKVKKSIQF